MRIQVDIHPRDVWRIQDKATRAGVTPGDVLRDELAVRRNSATIRERIRELVTEGMCDADIAAEVQYLPGTVATIRRSLGLKANPRYRKERA